MKLTYRQQVYAISSGVIATFHHLFTRNLEAPIEFQVGLAELVYFAAGILIGLFFAGFRRVQQSAD